MIYQEKPDCFLFCQLQLWMLSSLFGFLLLCLKTVEKLQARRSLAKLDIYRKFTNALAVDVFVSVAWIGYEQMTMRPAWELLQHGSCEYSNVGAAKISSTFYHLKDQGSMNLLKIPFWKQRIALFHLQIKKKCFLGLNFYF